MIQVLTEFLDNTQRSLTHLEMRDTYGTGSAGYQAWRKGVPLPEIERLDDYFTPWNDLVAAHVARGVSFRRARVISEPHSDYIAYEHAITPRSNLVGGEASDQHKPEIHGLARTAPSTLWGLCGLAGTRISKAPAVRRPPHLGSRSAKGAVC
jgi:uncharacterized protein DUF6879